MLRGLPFNTLVEEVNAKHKAKRDFLSLTSSVKIFSYEGSRPVLVGLTERPLSLNDTAQRQLADWTGMGFKYWQKCWTESPALIAANVNQWFMQNDHRRLFRCYDDPSGDVRLRAFLSERYERSDNMDLLQTALPVLSSIPNLRWEASSLSDDRMYLKVFMPSQTIEPVAGDILQTGCLIQNEETSLGSLQIMPMTYRLICTNGMTHTEFGERITHTKRAGFGSDSQWSDETKALTDQAMAAQIKDTLLNILSGQWAKLVEKQMQAAMGIKLENPVKDSEALLTRFELPKNDQELVINQFFREGQATLYGLCNAVTHVAHSEVDDFEKSTALEALGGRLLSLAK